MKYSFIKTLLTCAITLLLCLQFAVADNITYDENEVKVAFLYRSLQYVKWENIITETDTPITLCTLTSPALTGLIKTLHNRSVAGRNIKVTGVSRKSSFDNCNVIYIQAKSLKHFKSLINRLNNRQILTVNDNPDYSRHGSILNFITRNQKISIEVNLKQAKQANIVFSAKYLRIATIIDNGN